MIADAPDRKSCSAHKSANSSPSASSETGVGIIDAGMTRKEISMRAGLATVLLTGVFASGASIARADVPFFNATCPGHVEVHADEGGPVYLNGSEAKLHRFNANYYEASHGPMTVSISVNPDSSVTISYSRSGGGNGVCQVNAHQRHGRKVQPSAPAASLEVSMGDMPRFCAGEASAAFDLRPPEITTNMAFRIGNRYVVQGYFEGSRGTTFFNCYFSDRGKFVEVR
ncbi:hypothetical protein [Kumtagia ephedrae]|uniref:hypothetical protein n=1 Tax=Kumtagia ephedrae TaxID=2116701 RepID=UPI001A9C737C|nr:hypothetical protein [Mesorhizobium ephedrae]